MIQNNAINDFFLKIIQLFPLISFSGLFHKDLLWANETSKKNQWKKYEKNLKLERIILEKIWPPHLRILGHKKKSIGIAKIKFICHYYYY